MLPPPYPTNAAAASANSSQPIQKSSQSNAIPSALAHTGVNALKSFPPWDQPPQASWGWFVDVPPPRGPFFWPQTPDKYQLKPQRIKTDATSTAAASDANDTGSNEALFEYEPQLAWGWFCAAPPDRAPYFWPCLPEGYFLIRADELMLLTEKSQQQQNSSSQSISNNSSSASGVSASTPTSTIAVGGAASHAPPQRQSSGVTSNPLGTTATLPPPHAIATQPLPPPTSSVSSTISSTFSASPASSTGSSSMQLALPSSAASESVTSGSEDTTMEDASPATAVPTATSTRKSGNRRKA